MIKKTIRRKKHLGFTLIEMMVTVSVAAILLSIAVPSFTTMIKNARISSATNEFISSLILARSEALKRNDNVSLCSSSDLLTCSQDIEFANGWIVFQDCNRDGIIDAGANNANCVNNGTEQIIKVHEALNNLSVKANGGLSFISYRFTGRSTNTTISIGEKGKAASKRISITRTGRLRTESL